MKLSYRGVSYETTPQVEPTEREISGKYRGVFWRFRQRKQQQKHAQCDRCQFYSRDPHLLCAVHPHGPSAEHCPDFELDPNLSLEQ